MLGFPCCGEMLVTAAADSSVVRMGIMGGRETLVVVGTSGGGGV